MSILDRSHPNVHESSKEWSEEQILHVAVAYSNAFRWQTRRRLAEDCRRHFTTLPNVKLHIVELAYGDRPHEITDSSNPDDIQLRTNHELFHKENMLNVAIRHFPPTWKYGMVVDADFHMTRWDFALETIHQLQHYEWLQPFSSYTDVSGNVYGQAQLPVRQNTSFFFNYINNGFKVSPIYHNSKVGGKKEIVDGYESTMGGTFMRGTGASGGAMAFRRSAFEAVGGLMDKCILGHGDWYMSYGLVDVEPPDIHVRGYHPDYLNYIRAWRKRAQILKKNVGYVDVHAIHFFHGTKSKRGYSSRDLILSKHGFSPEHDIYPDYQGIYQLTPDKPGLRDDIRQYFISRSEDDTFLARNEQPMV